LTLEGELEHPVIGVFVSRKAADAAADLYASKFPRTQVEYSAFTMNALVGDWPLDE